MSPDNSEDVKFMQQSADLCRSVDELAGELGSMTVKLASAEAEIASLKRRIEDLDKGRAAFVKRASEAAQVFARRGVIGSDAVNTFADQAAHDPCSVFDPLEKIAETTPATDLGGPSAEFRSRSAEDPNSLWYGLAFGISPKNDGTVD